MTDYNLFPGAAPSVAVFDSGLSVNLGTDFKVTAPGWVTQIRHLQGHAGPDITTTVRSGSIWQVDVVAGAYSYTKVAGPFALPAPTALESWTAYTLPAPFALTPGQLYRIAIQYPSGGYPALGHYFDGSIDFQYGIVTVPAASNVLNNMQGTFLYTANVEEAPDSSFNNSSYYSDVTITDVDPSGGADVTASPSGIASAEAFGSPASSTALVSSATGIASGEAFGTASALRSLTSSPAGVASDESFGNPQALMTLSAAPNGISSGEVWGTTTAVKTLVSSPAGIGSGAAFGVCAWLSGPPPQWSGTATVKRHESGTWVSRTGIPKARRSGAWVPAAGKRWDGTAWTNL